MYILREDIRYIVSVVASRGVFLMAILHLVSGIARRGSSVICHIELRNSPKQPNLALFSAYHIFSLIEVAYPFFANLWCFDLFTSSKAISNPMHSLTGMPGLASLHVPTYVRTYVWPVCVVSKYYYITLSFFLSFARSLAPFSLWARKHARS